MSRKIRNRCTWLSRADRTLGSRLVSYFMSQWSELLFFTGYDASDYRDHAKHRNEDVFMNLHANGRSPRQTCSACYYKITCICIAHWYARAHTWCTSASESRMYRYAIREIHFHHLPFPLANVISFSEHSHENSKCGMRRPRVHHPRINRERCMHACIHACVRAITIPDPFAHPQSAIAQMKKRKDKARIGHA